MSSILLDAFKGTNQTVPVWFMRQAGRYLPEYQAIKNQYSLDQMFDTPELAADITCLPIGILKVDAAILFADILTLPSAMGATIHFDNSKGPIIEQVDSINGMHDFENLSHVEQTIKIVKQKLPRDVPLIGFAGAPFTVLTYLVEGGSSLNFLNTVRFIEQKGEDFHSLMQLLTDNTIRYFTLQREAGIDVFQLFDSWAGILRPSDYAKWVLPYVKQIFSSIDIPSIYYLKNSHHLLPLMNQCDADVLSVDHTVVLGHHTIIGKTDKGIQGNLFNGLIYADLDTIKKEVKDVLVGGKKHSRYIFNLSHGVLPDSDVDKLKCVVECVHAFSWK